MRAAIIAIISALCAAQPAIAQSTEAQKLSEIVRKPLITRELALPKLVGSVRGVRVTFRPLQQTGQHQHPIPVVGYIVSGDVNFQVQGQPPQVLHAGDAFVEPANTTIVHFDNASGSAPATFVGFYLLGPGETEIIRASP